jgi:glycosyltransferase involved in cell wall biosynthesis
MTFVGDGRLRTMMEKLAAKLGLSDAVEFAGGVPAGLRVREYLDGSDLFILPSRSEGLPRALLESMARGLPCLATDVGGNRELLPEEALVGSDCPLALAERILECAKAPDLLSKWAEQNLKMARAYHFSNGLEQRGLYYSQLIAITRAGGRKRIDAEHDFKAS